MAGICLTLEKIEKQLLDPRIDINDRNLLRMGANELIQRLNCNVCSHEDSEIASFGMLYYFCELDENIRTRSYDEKCLNKPICPAECPIKKMYFKFEQ